jgi:2-polyprenyl-3-methyl-5-hydroxy-6-metoxy-1,4-benzoquinol methylase
MEESEKCRICNSVTKLKWDSNLDAVLSSDSFAITDAHYGKTSAVYQCTECGFYQCNDLPEVLSYYQELEDLAYEQGRKERYLQAKALTEELKNHISSGKLLDVGAGSGILVEAAIDAGYEAMGVEPSAWLQGEAEKQNLPVVKGILSDIGSEHLFEIITLIDVLEHVVDPLSLLKEIRSRLSTNGYAMVVTPDCSSFFAKCLRRKWWHFRVAHIGYFNGVTLEMACKLANLEVVAQRRPGWFFTMDYLWVRMMQYFPNWLRFGPFNWMKNVTIPINLRDSLLVVLKPIETTPHGHC